MSVIDLASARQDREAALWQAYVTAKARADETLSPDDGRAAGRAWRAFLAMSETTAQSVLVNKRDLLATYNPEYRSAAV